jgi:hypothetical protein
MANAPTVLCPRSLQTTQLTHIEKNGRTNLTKVVHVRKSAFDIYIGRAFAEFNESDWHNPFHLGKDGNRKEVLRKYREYLLSRPDLLSHLSELKDKTLGCWCKPKLACHGDVLVELVNELVLGL